MEATTSGARLVQEAIALSHAGDAERAVEALTRALPLIDHQEHSHLLFSACYNLVRCHIDLGRPQQGLAFYFRFRDLFKEFNKPLLRYRTARMEGQLLRDLGHLRAAEVALLRARTGFLKLGLPDEAALASFDLLTVYKALQEL